MNEKIENYRKLYSDSSIEVWISEAGSQDVVISFSAMGHNIRKKGLPAERALRANGYDVIGVVSKYNNWYPSASINLAAEVVKDVIDKYNLKISYGSSMGAYAALKYSRAFQAEYTIALAPQFSINPKHVSSWDKRYLRFFKSDIHENMEITKKDIFGCNVIIYDPLLRSDSNHALHIASLGNVDLIPGIGCGHLVIQPVASSVILGKLISLVVKNDIKEARLLYKSVRKKSSYYKGFLFKRLSSRYLKRNSLEKSNYYIEAAISCYDKVPGFYVAASEVRAQLKDFEGSLKYALQAQIMAPESEWVASAVHKAQRRLDINK